MRGADAVSPALRLFTVVAASFMVAGTPAFARAALSDASRIGFTGVGPIVFGTTPAQAEATGARLRATKPARGSSCYYLLSALPGLKFLVESGTLRRAEVTYERLATADGFRIGDSLEKLRAAYGSRAQLAPDKYDPAVRTLTVEPAGAASAKYRMIYKIGAGRVRTIYAGAMPQVAYVEGCS